MIQPFNQPPPVLGNQYDDDRVLRSHLRRTLPPDVMSEVEPDLVQMGELSGGELLRAQLDDRTREPMLTQWDAWGERVDRVTLTPLWQRAERIAAESGLVAAAYEQRYGRYSRPYQFALAYLFHPSTDVYTCPLAMTDGAARTLLRSGNRFLIDRALPHLTSRDPGQFWTSGQWMTESTGGSDVGTVETTALPDPDAERPWRLYGRKWFTSAATSQMALVLARPDGNPPGGRGLALFYLETRDAVGCLRSIQINRLKDKLGTRKLPTAELTLDGAPAYLVSGTTNGVAAIVPMLHLTRTWNSVTAVSAMRRGLALARSYAQVRAAFGSPLATKPLHVDTLAGLQAEMEAAFQLAFLVVELIGRDEAGELDEEGTVLLRLLTSVAKLTTGRQAVALASEVLEAFGGAGYVEDTGLPMLLRDSQIFPIWEGTTNVLSLDTLRALGKGETLDIVSRRARRAAEMARDPALVQAAAAALRGLEHATAWFGQARAAGQGALEAGARRLALTLGRSLALALLVEAAQWSLDQDGDPRPRAAARRFALAGVDWLADPDLGDSYLLANDQAMEDE